MAAVLGAFVPDTAVRWRGVVTGDVAGRMGVAAEARALAGRLERVGAAVGDAQARAARGEEGAARWLANVRAAAYEADAVADRCRVAARRSRLREQQSQQQQQPHHHQARLSIHHCFSRTALPRLLSSCCNTDVPGGDIAADIKSLNRKLQVILKEKNRLQLRSFLGDHHATPVRTAPRHHRTSQASRAPDSGIFGSRIEDDVAGLVRQLTEADGRAGCAIVAVIGPDGIGKTKLAAKVYGSERIRRSFGARSWVRVPREYTEASLLSQVIDSFGGDTTGGESFADLEKTLARLVEKKRFLLVLDDVRYGGVWEDVLRRPLEGAGRGGKVLVTARHGSIAREMGAGHVHRVKKLGAYDGWLLLRAAACVIDEAAAGELKDVGERIAEKCGGVPLAIKAVAGVLRTREASAKEWAEVLASPAWLVKGLPEDAMKPLYLCYDDLPCHLKQCFLYCSLFPSDLAMDRRVLVQQWIAEGFVQIRADASVEEVAEEYYDELIRRHLLQPAEEDEHGGVAQCTMHDILRALAQLLSQGEDLTGDSYRLLVDSDASFAPRRVSFPRRNLAMIPEKILKLEGLRTLLLQKNPLKIEGSIFTRLEHLKVLDLSETAVQLIPDSLGNLVYLRFLNLSHTRIQAIPESIANLWSLKFLLLRGCKSLHALPKGIEHLRGLRDLDLAGTAIDDAAFRVGHLRSLTSLRCFAVTSKEARAAQDKSAWPLDELKNLSQLRTLHIQKLEKAAGRSEATEMSLAAKKGLRELELSCSSTVRPLQTPELVRKIEDIFEEMNPPLCLESLKLVNYFGTRFPRWLSVTSLPNLRDLDIVGCNFCQSFPPLGRLPELRSLFIADSSALKDIGVEFMRTDHPHQVPFPKLENLHLQGLQQLETWRDIEPGALPSLQILKLESCPKLQHLPDGLRHVTSLTELRIADMASLEAVDDIAKLRELSAWNTPSLKRISNLPSLEDISMCHCPVLEIVENVDGLRTVHIFDHDLWDMPRWIEAHASKLQSLNFTSTVGLLKRCLVDGLDWPVIKDIKEVHGYSTGSSYIYYTRSPYIFESNVSAEDNIHVKENEADPDNADDVSVSSSGIGYLEIRGFFDSKELKTGTTMTEENVLGRSMEKSTPRLTHRRLHKLPEVIPEDDEVEDEEDSVVLLPSNPTRATASVAKVSFVVTDDHNDSNDLGSLSKATSHESQAITNDETHDDNIQTSVFTRRSESKTGKDSSDSGTDGYASVTPIGHNLVRQGSRAINITAINQDFNCSTVRCKEHTSKKGEGTTADFTSAKDTSLAHSGQVMISKKGIDDFADNATATTCSSNMVTRRHIKSKIATSANGSTNATLMQENPSGKEVLKKSAGVPGSSFIHEASHTVFVTETTSNLGSNLIHGKQQSSDKEGDVSSALGPASAVGCNGNQMDDGNISSSVKLNQEESKAICAGGSNCDSGPCKVPSSFTCNNEHTQKMPQTVSTDPVPSDCTDASKKKIPGMASKIAEKVSTRYVVESVKDSSAKTTKTIIRSLSEPAHTLSHAIDTTEAAMKPEAPTASRFSPNAAVSHGSTQDDAPCSINAKADDDSHQAPKVYTAIWADTDTDTLRARFLDTMRHMRRMASRRRHRRRKHGSKNKWSIGPAVVAVLLLVSVVQLLFILWVVDGDVKPSPPPPAAEVGEEEAQICPPEPPKREIVRVTRTTIKEKASAFSSVGSAGKDRSGTGGALGAAVFKRFHSSAPVARAEGGRVEAAEDGDLDSGRGGDVRLDVEEIGAASRPEPRNKRKSPLGGDEHGSDAKARRVVVLGDDPRPRPAWRRGRARPTRGGGVGHGGRALYNHYASGGGWWHGDMEGVDGEEVGWTDDMWEGMGSVTLGGLEWH
ncbi:putative disease resistance RPP13-like protein 1 [Dichanthelium oligosanthes]|uniref:Putative disease resistance RPP13-like protein 1 n=1 Tax=Dichanthelium oligosanthes TaxID=888268 RepID=A0A1E5WEH8_9POAL|nr:putative disease resistance RPP13-like protein 1 [Dichanthelium oligosanthes]